MGCEWTALKQNRPEVADFVRELDLVTTLEPRDAFFGGRTNATKLLYNVKPGEKVKYVDFTSLYPYVNKYCFCPVDHPDEFLDHVTHKDISRYFGIAKVTVIPPRDLYLAVLPLRSSNKLIFPLCKTCMETEMPKSMHERTHICPHTDQNDSLLELSGLQKLKRLWRKGVASSRFMRCGILKKRAINYLEDTLTHFSN